MANQKYMRMILLLHLLLIVFIFAQSNVYANEHAQTSSIRVSPAVLEFAFIPEETQSKTVRITNEGNQPAAYRLQIENFLFSNASLQQQIDPRFNIRNWITLSQTDLLLAPSETQEFQVNITPPSNASAGGHYAQLFAQPLFREGNVDQDNVQVFPELSIPILTTVAGNSTVSFSLERQAGSSRYYRVRTAPVEASFSVVNNGTTHALIRPVATLFRGGEQVKEIELDSQLILPTERKDIAAFFEPLPELGRYDVELALYLGNEQQESASYTVWSVPSAPVAFSLIISCLLLMHLFYYRRNIMPALYTLTGRSIESKQ